MADPELVQSILARKRAGVERMRLRQQRVHERLAAYVESDPEAMHLGLARVREQLNRPLCTAQSVYHDWEQILTEKSSAEVAAILRDTSPETDQLRACAPFFLPAAAEGESAAE